MPNYIYNATHNTATPIKLTGVLDAATVKALQFVLGVQETGKIGYTTATELQKALNNGFVTTTPVPPPPSSVTVITSPPSTQNSPASALVLEQWIAEAFTVLKANGTPASELADPANTDVMLIIAHESSGIPNAVNTVDSNAQAGHPSTGLMQTILPTFQAWALPGYNIDMTDPVSNIVAATRYAIGTYGSLENVPGVISVNNGGPYVGY